MCELFIEKLPLDKWLFGALKGFPLFHDTHKHTRTFSLRYSNKWKMRTGNQTVLNSGDNAGFMDSVLMYIFAFILFFKVFILESVDFFTNI